MGASREFGEAIGEAVEEALPSAWVSVLSE